MRTVWKFEVALDDSPTMLDVPAGAVVVHVDSAFVDGVGQPLWVWLDVPDTEAPVEQRWFLVRGTGQAFGSREHHRGVVRQGFFVWHLLEVVS